MHLSDTIAALASAAGGAARGIVRISGPRALGIALADFQPPCDAGQLREPTALPWSLRLPQLHSPLPATLYCWPDQRSYTRQPTVEIHTLGSPPLLQLVLNHLLRSGARLAEPGEFTLRAFLSGRLDLTQAEAVLGLIDARHDGQFAAALAQLAGGMSRPLHHLREQLLDLLAHLEAGLDFAGEDIEFITPAELDGQLQQAVQQVESIRIRMQARLETDDLPRVVLIGWPNVGKSSLFNALAGQERAIVSPVAGTTRDYLCADLQLRQMRYRLIDTAGVEPGDSTSVLFEAQRHRTEQQSTSTLEVLCLDGARLLNAWERELLTSDVNRLVVTTKADLPCVVAGLPTCVVHTSAATSTGLEALRERIAEMLCDRTELHAVASTAVRCQNSLGLAAECLARARALTVGGFEELVAAEVRTALEEIGKVVGAVYTDDILDRIFSRFCIGK